MIDRETRMKLLGLDQFPTLPEVMVRILEAIEDDESSAEDLGALLEQDHAITVRLLRLANSAFYGFPSQVDTVQRAVVLIGYNEVRLLALATSVFDTFSQIRQYALDPRDFWLHALGTAKAASLLASQMHAQCSPEACFTAGLLHDMGKYALAAVLHNTYKKIVANAQERGVLVRDSEREILNTTHPEVGAWLAQQWSFPEDLRQPIENLYEYEYAGPYRTETLIVALSDQLSRLAGFGVAGDPPTAVVSPDLLTALNLTDDDVRRRLETLQVHLGDAEHVLDILNGE